MNEVELTPEIKETIDRILTPEFLAKTKKKGISPVAVAKIVYLAAQNNPNVQHSDSKTLWIVLTQLSSHINLEGSWIAMSSDKKITVNADFEKIKNCCFVGTPFKTEYSHLSETAVWMNNC